MKFLASSMKKKQLEELLTVKINKMMNQFTMRRDIGIISPLEVDIPQNSKLIGTTIAESDIWHNTGATIISVRRDGNNHLSPGPDWILQEWDTIIFVGKKNSYPRVIDFVK